MGHYRAGRNQKNRCWKIEEYENYILFYVGETAGLHRVGFFIKKMFKNNIVNFQGISERIYSKT